MHEKPSTTFIRPTPAQMEKLRLILSTYQDGTGMLIKDGKSLPGWRDFERAVAIVFGGKAQESKHVFDVIVPLQERKSNYGISCNKDNPTKAGIVLVNSVKHWHNTVSLKDIDLGKSFYLILEWDGKGKAYQLFQYSLELPDPKTLHWHFPSVSNKDGEEKPALRLVGDDTFGTVFEWYGSSGGQLKYYPLTDVAAWYSDTFQLEPLPNLNDLEYGVVAKAKTYFPVKWSDL